MNTRPSRRELLAAGSGLVGAAAWSRGLGVKAEDPEAALTLRRWLAWNRERHPEFGGGLSNHLSMALCALYDLGAGAPRLEAFAKRYSSQLEPFPTAGERVEWARWTESIGDGDALHGFVQLFEARIRERGGEEVLRECLLQFVNNIGAAAFHCAIRCAYAVRFRDDLELAHGLGYWAIQPTLLGGLPEMVGDEVEPLVLLAHARDSKSLGRQRIDGGLITEEMSAAARLAGFDAVVGRLRVDEGTLARIAGAAVGIYAATRDFTALHTVTATHAVRILLPYVGDQRTAMKRHWQALVAAYVAIGTPAIDLDEGGEPPGWDALLAAAVASDDDHDVKLADTCRQEEAAYGSLRYRRAASRRLGLQG